MGQYVECERVRTADSFLAEAFKSAIEQGVLEWMDLPMNIRGNVGFALSLNHELALPDAISTSSKLLVLWGRIIELLGPKPNSNLALMIATYAPADVRSNFQLMLTACSYDPDVVACIDQFLLSSRMFVTSLLEAEPSVLAKLPPQTQRLFPDLVVDAFDALCQQKRRLTMAFFKTLSSNIAQELWSNRRTVLKWFEAGLPFIDDRASGTWCQDDREISMLIARHCRSEFRLRSFFQASPVLCQDKDFMLEVLAVDAMLYFCMSESLKSDFDLSVLAFSGSSKTIEFNNLDVEADGKENHVSVISAKVTHLLELHDTFHATVLRGISGITNGSEPEPEPSSTLLALNQGTETSASHKRLIAAYLGIPTGERLAMLRRASANITLVSR